jgi:hypothetical protein
VWNMVHSCLLWCLWRERNDKNFGGVNLLGLPGVSVSFPCDQWVLFPHWPRPVPFVVGHPQLTGLSSRVVEVGES